MTKAVTERGKSQLRFRFRLRFRPASALISLAFTHIGMSKGCVSGILGTAGGQEMRLAESRKMWRGAVKEKDVAKSQM